MEPQTEPLIDLSKYYGKKNLNKFSLEQELKEFMLFMKRINKSSAGPFHSMGPDHDAYIRSANILFNIWNKYKHRLPLHFYHEQLLMVGDFLAQLKFHALQGKSICNYQLVIDSDGSLLNLESMKKCMNILTFLRLIMQVVLPQERLCWLIYNGTIHIYTICRHLMILGHSAKAFEYLLWASICMESSVPLLTVRYLKWRTILYASVCQCYFDCQIDLHAEIFARRSLCKIQELSQLENMSSSTINPEDVKIFKESVIKMSVIIFKRAVIETRRKPKGLLRPKQRVLPWPHNSTESLLAEMFDGSAAQFLAILEAVTNSYRRVLHTGPPLPAETEVYDVLMELILAGVEILAVFVIRKWFVKAIFCYEHWDIFDNIIGPKTCQVFDGAILFHSLQNSVPDKDMVVDAVLFLWQKCKMVLQRTQIGNHSDVYCYLVVYTCIVTIILAFDITPVFNTSQSPSQNIL
uniref:Cilia and flagella associated protein 54 n=1 Tax=Callorhinchus milii TaxID=7868 RepID=A0A4W3JAL1_CALMI